MKKNIILILVLCLYLFNCYVLAESKDIEAKFDTSYNVNLVKVNLNNNSKLVFVDGYELEISTSMEDVEIIIIKNDDEAKKYVEGFSSSDENYSLIFYQDGKKVVLSDVNIKINNTSKVLNIYSNNGKLVNKSNEKINLNSNDYFFVISEKIDINEDDYIITDDGNEVDSIDDIDINDDSDIKVYNSNNIEIDNSSILGTNYKVVVTTDGDVVTFVIVVKGDTTGDAKVNLNDITRLYHNYKGIENMDDVFVIAGDVAKNDIINLNDVTKLYHYYKKIIPSL